MRHVETAKVERIQRLKTFNQFTRLEKESFKYYHRIIPSAKRDIFFKTHFNANANSKTLHKRNLNLKKIILSKNKSHFNPILI